MEEYNYERDEYLEVKNEVIDNFEMFLNMVMSAYKAIDEDTKILSGIYQAYYFNLDEHRGIEEEPDLKLMIYFAVKMLCIKYNAGIKAVDEYMKEVIENDLLSRNKERFTPEDYRLMCEDLAVIKENIPEKILPDKIYFEIKKTIGSWFRAHMATHKLDSKTDAIRKLCEIHFYGVSIYDYAPYETGKEAIKIMNYFALKLMCMENETELKEIDEGIKEILDNDLLSKNKEKLNPGDYRFLCEDLKVIEASMK